MESNCKAGRLRICRLIGSFIGFLPRFETEERDGRQMQKAKDEVQLNICSIFFRCHCFYTTWTVFLMSLGFKSRSACAIGKLFPGLGRRARLKTVD